MSALAARLHRRFRDEMLKALGNVDPDDEGNRKLCETPPASLIGHAGEESCSAAEPYRQVFAA